MGARLKMLHSFTNVHSANICKVHNVIKFIFNKIYFNSGHDSMVSLYKVKTNTIFFKENIEVQQM